VTLALTVTLRALHQLLRARRMQLHSLRTSPSSTTSSSNNCSSSSSSRKWTSFAVISSGLNVHAGPSSSHSLNAGHDSSSCVTIPAPEGLVFELNNRVPHKVANPGPGIRVHLVIDVFEEPKTRTRLPAGATCEYGSSAQLVRHLTRLTADIAEEEALAAQIQRLLGTAGMVCWAKDGEYVFPKLPPSSTPQAEQTGQELLEISDRDHAAAGEGRGGL